MTLLRLACGIALTLLLVTPVLAQTQVPPPPSSGTVNGQPGPGRGGFMRILQSLNLTPDQNQQIQALVNQYHQSHPPGSAPDPDAMRTIRQQVMQILTPAQRQQLQTQLQQMREQRSQQRGQVVPQASPSPVP